MKHVIAICAWLPAWAIGQGLIEPVNLPPSLSEVRTKALQNDYQAQRNLAFTYGSGGFELKDKTYPVAACGWYTAIVHLHPKRASDGDLSNAYVYCSKLKLNEYGRAITYSSVLVNQLIKTSK